MKYNYPIMYAVMPIQTKDCRDGVPYTIYNIISKCYVLEERIKYTDYGEEYTEYHVDFPFKNDCSSIFRKVYPDAHNVFVKENIYRYYEEALEEKERCNAELILSSSYGSFEEYEARMQEKELYFHNLEELIEKNTPELHVGKIPKTHITIEMADNEKKFYIRPDSFYFNLYSLTDSYDKGANFIIYSLSDEDCYRLRSALLDRKETDITRFMHTPLIMGTKGVDMVKLVSPSGEKCDLMVRRDYCWFPKDNRFTRDKSFGEPSHFDKIFFTNETYIDVLNSFSLNPEISSTIDLGYQRKMWSLYKL